jgi:hypothetical protein
MKNIHYDQKRFRSVSNSDNGEVSSETIFHYHQNEHLVWAEYAGGGVVQGYLIAKANNEGELDMRYQHLSSNGQLMTGICKSTPEILADGRIRLYERWQWTCSDYSSGESVLEEITE